MYCNIYMLCLLLSSMYPSVCVVCVYMCVCMYVCVITLYTALLEVYSEDELQLKIDNYHACT